MILAILAIIVAIATIFFVTEVNPDNKWILPLKGVVLVLASLFIIYVLSKLGIPIIIKRGW